MTWVGRSLPRLEDPTLVRGHGNYVADVARGAASVRFVRSPVASGTILGIEKPEDGIVFTAADLDGIKGIKPILHRPDYVAVEQPLLARERVVFAGQAIAVVVGEDHAAAEDIAEQVFVDIDPVDAALDVDLALAAGAPVVHEQAPGNVLVEGKMRTPGRDEDHDRDPFAAAGCDAARDEGRLRAIRPGEWPGCIICLSPDAAHVAHR